MMVRYIFSHYYSQMGTLHEQYGSYISFYAPHKSTSCQELTVVSIYHEKEDDMYVPVQQRKWVFSRDTDLARVHSIYTDMLHRG